MRVPSKFRAVLSLIRRCSSPSLLLVLSVFCAAEGASAASTGVTLLLLKGSSVPAKKIKVLSLPITIAAAGTYQLTSNIVVPDANTDAIQVMADDVTVDLNGFTIQGPTVCTGFPMISSCTPSGTGRGIWAPLPFVRTTIRNGTIRGVGGSGIFVNDDSVVRNVMAFSNGLFGIAAPGVEGCTANGNGGTGIANVFRASACTSNRNHDHGITGGGAVTNSFATANGGTGINALNVTGCVTSGNGLDGITATTVSDCTSNRNGGGGIRATTVSSSSASANGGAGIVDASAVSGCTAFQNAGDGISGETVTGSNATNNDGRGIVATTVANSSARANLNDGIVAQTVLGSTSNSNNSGGFPDGIVARTVLGSTSNDNTGNGVSAVTVAHSNASGNGQRGIADAHSATGCSADVNSLDGITGVAISNSEAQGNAGVDIAASGITGSNICGVVPATCP